MKKLFIESPGFTARIADYVDDDEFALFQKSLSAMPDLGKVIPGCAGLRKARVSVRKQGMGKRGGARVIYMHVPERNWIYLADIYGKGDRGDLSPGEKKILKRLAQAFREEALKPLRTL